ncbi:MAG TPA: cytochrome c oxidase subunit 3 [bacterium]|nr:cytochrome c oxidase subunit 3 [bacterium]
MAGPHLAAASNGNHGNGNGKRARDVPTKDRPAPGAGPLGMAIFLVSLAVLFLASLVAYVVIRFQADVWPPPDLPPLPRSLILSTALIFLGSVTIQAAVAFARANRQWALRASLLATFLLGCAFLVSQTVSWAHLVIARTTPTSHLFGWLFYFLTGLHAAHVVGGLIPLGVVTVNAFYGRYSPLRDTGVRFSAIYWHFLGAVWITLYGTIALTV